jgi:predicted Zn-dependent protease
MSQNGGSGLPDLLSTHPSDANRIAEMRKNLPEALKYYKK